MQQRDFLDLVTSAYQQLYDLVQLRTNPLADLLLENSGLTAKEKGWKLHHLLLDVLNELAPGDNAPVHSREWRRHRLLVLRFVDALEPQQVAEKLAISRRQFYRDLADALQSVSDILWSRRLSETARVEPTPESIPHADLLHSETARLAQSDTRADVEQVLSGVSVLLKRIIEDHEIDVQITLSDPVPTVHAGRNALRQTLLGLIGFLVNHSRQATLEVTATVTEDAVCLELRHTPPLHALPAEEMRWLDSLNDMLHLSQGHIHVCSGVHDCMEGFDVTLSRKIENAILVVDDNADMLALYERYLAANGYHVLMAQNAASALDIARQAQPKCVFLDLMMPLQDGWELLQALLADPITLNIPVVVCSVLRQQDLALALGATAFLEKPITEQALLHLLKDVVERKAL